MIRINDEFSYKRGIDCWILMKKIGGAESKSIKEQFTTRYYVTLEQLMAKLLGDTAIGAENVHDVLEALTKVKEEILSAIECKLP